MCRMIAAVGRFEPTHLRHALVRMAANDNPAHDHEYRALGESFRHTDGWGMAWVQDGRLRTLRRTISVLLDDWVERIDPLRTGLLLLHARYATPPKSIRTENTHPFSATLLGRDWAFCHNGAVAVEDLEGLRHAPEMAAAGSTDSERLFHHFLAELAARTEPDAATELNDVSVVRGDGRTGAGAAGENSTPPMGRTLPEAALAATIAVPRDFTALHCLAASNDRVLAAARRHPEKSRPDYHALWLGEGPDLQVVSSEPVDGLGCEWTRLPEPGVITLEVL
jgi:predicted glutamine amidotransferase